MGLQRQSEVTHRRARPRVNASSSQPHRLGGGRAEPHSAPRGLVRSPHPPGRGHSLAKGEVAVEPLRKLGDPGTPRPVTPGAP